MNRTFLEDIDSGLSQSNKHLSSRYFYDAAGDKLFQEIMEMPEYYLTRAELEIFKTQSKEIIKAFNLKTDVPFEVIELGAGDGLKTKELLEVLMAESYQFNYVPIDISANALASIQERMQGALPSLKVLPKQGDYFEILDDLKGSNKQKVVLFLGSNLGNMTDDIASNFLGNLSDKLNSNDIFLLGLDLIKPKEIIAPAYNDAQNITARFNLNLLRRINREFSADFAIDHFSHAPVYDAVNGVAKSYIKSNIAQTVKIEALDKTFHFEKDELIHTEISRKYSDEILKKILQNTGLTIDLRFTDSKVYFADYILIKS